jgi:hypothetical protein
VLVLYREGIETPAIVLSSHILSLAVTCALAVMGVPIVVMVYDERDDTEYGSIDRGVDRWTSN